MSAQLAASLVRLAYVSCLTTVVGLCTVCVSCFTIVVGLCSTLVMYFVSYLLRLGQKFIRCDSGQKLKARTAQ